MRRTRVVGNVIVGQVLGVVESITWPRVIARGRQLASGACVVSARSRSATEEAEVEESK